MGLSKGKQPGEAEKETPGAVPRKLMKAEVAAQAGGHQWGEK